MSEAGTGTSHRFPDGRTIRMLHSLALVRFDEKLAMTDGGLHIPEIGQRQAPLGTVMAVGPGRWCPCRREDGSIDRARHEFLRTELQPGDRVAIGPFNGKRVDETLRIADPGREWWVVETLPQVTSEWSPFAEADTYMRESRAGE